MKKEIVLIMLVGMIGISNAYGDPQINLEQAPGQTDPPLTITDNTSNVLFQVLSDGQAIINEFIQLSGSGLTAIRTYIFPDSDGTVVLEDTPQTITNKIIDAESNSISNIDDTEVKTSAGIDVSKLSSGFVDNTEFDYLDGITSNIQTQLNAKESTVNKNAANGYAGLGAGGLVSTAQLGTGSASSSTFLRGDGSWDTLVGVPKIVKLDSDIVTDASSCCVDVTGLSFSVVSGKIYHFKFLIIWDSPGTNKGVGLTLNGPTTTFLTYDVIYPTSTTAGSIHGRNSYNSASAVGNSPSTTNNLGIIEGIIQPSTTGTLIVRFVEDTAPAAGDITIKANSIGFLTEIP